MSELLNPYSINNPRNIEKVVCKKHGEHDVAIQLLKTNEFICMLCVRDLVGTMEVELCKI